MEKNKKKYVLYYDTPSGLGGKVDYIEYSTKEEVNNAIEEYKEIDSINGNKYEYYVMEIE